MLQLPNLPLLSGRSQRVPRPFVKSVKGLKSAAESMVSSKKDAAFPLLNETTAPRTFPLLYEYLLHLIQTDRPLVTVTSHNRQVKIKYNVPLPVWDGYKGHVKREYTNEEVKREQLNLSIISSSYPSLRAAYFGSSPEGKSIMTDLQAKLVAQATRSTMNALANDLEDEDPMAWSLHYHSVAEQVSRLLQNDWMPLFWLIQGAYPQYEQVKA